MRSAEEKTNLQGAVSPPPHNALSPIGAGYATNSNGVGLMPPVTLPSNYICNNSLIIIDVQVQIWKKECIICCKGQSSEQLRNKEQRTKEHRETTNTEKQTTQRNKENKKKKITGRWL